MFAGSVYDGKLPVVEPTLGGEFEELLKMVVTLVRGTCDLLRQADSVAKVQVLANADTPKDAAQALKFGAQVSFVLVGQELTRCHFQGIGLTRTEHMFFDAKVQR